MAEPEHLKILNKGIKAFNKWRRENSIKTVNLVKADLSGAILSKADLRRADLSGAILIETDLSKADLSGAFLSKANLSGADLSGADLSEADLSEADLSEADLSKANLIEANIRGANLSEANLSEGNLIEANLIKANIRGADLSKANLSGAILTKENLYTVILVEANLSGVDLRRTYLPQKDLSKANLSGAHLSEADLSEADLIMANLSRANLRRADLSGADLIGADLSYADLSNANLSKANLVKANLTQANLSRTNLSGADLSEADLILANLSLATLVETRLEGANISNSLIYGISAWNLKINQETKQFSLTITHIGEPHITVDNLEVAQFIHLLLNRKKLRKVIDTITSKSVLILGRFTPERKSILDSMANELREHNLIPIIFDFKRASSRDFTETIKTLAGLSLFVIADVTNPKSAPLELQATVPDYKIPFVPILEKGEEPFSMLPDLLTFPWVLPLLEYESSIELINTFESAIIEEAFNMHKKLLMQKAKMMKSRSTKDYLNEST
jgi:uncharacterized protein YjbI with pentapeptide repeats